MSTNASPVDILLGSVTCVAVAVCCIAVSAAPQAATDVDALMARVGERVVEYYRRTHSLICIEHSTVQPVQSNWTADGFARTVESELRVESTVQDNGLPEPTMVRNVRHINGRAPTERDARDRSGCTDPSVTSPEPLAFLLPGRRDTYRFISVRDGKERDRPALIIDFASSNSRSRPELVEDERGHADCFDWLGSVSTSGRVWVDAATLDVLRIERHNTGPVDVQVSWKLQRRYNLPPWVVIERDDLTLRFKPVAFTDPDEVILLPESLTALTVIRSGLQSIRRTDTYSSYRRFLTKGRMVK